MRGKMKKIFTKNQIICFVIALSSFIICTHKIGSADGYSNLFLMPLTYMVVCFFSMKTFRYLQNSNVCFKLMQLVFLLRFVILPLLISLSSKDIMVGVKPSSGNIAEAVYLMSYECVIIFLLVEFIVWKKGLHKKELIEQKIQLNFNLQFFYIIIAISFILVLWRPEFLTDYRFFWQKNINYKSTNLIIEIPIRFAALMLQYCLTVVLLKSIATKYIKSHSNLFLLGLYVVCFVNMSIVRGDNRMMMVLNVVATLVYINKLIPKIKSLNNLIIGVLLIIIISSVTMVKTFGNTSSENVFVINDITKWFQLYLGGPREVALSIQLATDNSFSFATLFKDLIQSWNVIGVIGSKIQGSTTNSLFNSMVSISNMDAFGQIMPILGQGFYHLGFIFAPLFDVSISYFAIAVDVKIGKVNIAEYVYGLTNIGCASALAMGLSLSGYTQIISWVGIPICLITFINIKYRLKWR